ncbi:hypothetical protein BpHYR1_010429 [Brachionus plicatilis]|uniref:Uncharacterized protein n=1 Tax=Brachionus plicatilis TaxID=10195 RepID=A0A3M7T8S4_BRAPC|nr:hypothetical protein BpHYR1_010429 [Brachionus plicatilis]
MKPAIQSGKMSEECRLLFLLQFKVKIVVINDLLSQESNSCVSPLKRRRNESQIREHYNMVFNTFMGWESLGLGDRFNETATARLACGDGLLGGHLW